MKHELSTPARLLARHLRDKQLAELTHSQALEALSHAIGGECFNIVKTQIPLAKPDAAPSVAEEKLDVRKLLRQAIEAGLTPGMALEVFAENRCSEDLAYLEAARRNHEREGELEFDDNAVVSISDDRGAYVMSWTWVEDSELESPQELAQALNLRFETMTVCLDEQDVDAELGYGDADIAYAALEALAEGKEIAEDTVVLRCAEPPFELTLAQARLMHYESSEDAYCATTEAGELYIKFQR